MTTIHCANCGGELKPGDTFCCFAVDAHPRVDLPTPEGMDARGVEALIRASSLGTPEAVALRATVPDEVAHAIVFASKCLDRAERAEAELDALRRATGGVL